MLLTKATYMCEDFKHGWGGNRFWKLTKNDLIGMEISELSPLCSCCFYFCSGKT